LPLGPVTAHDQTAADPGGDDHAHQIIDALPGTHPVLGQRDAEPVQAKPGWGIRYQGLHKVEQRIAAPNRQIQR
jgi:hypothetical protein